MKEIKLFFKWLHASKLSCFKQTFIKKFQNTPIVWKKGILHLNDDQGANDMIRVIEGFVH